MGAGVVSLGGKKQATNNAVTIAVPVPETTNDTPMPAAEASPAKGLSRRNSRRASFYKESTENDAVKIMLDGLSDTAWYDLLIHSELCTMNYDCLTATDDERTLHLMTMMDNLRVPKTLGLETKDLAPFLSDVKGLMRDNPYHNFCHITDVTQFVYTLLLSTHIAGLLRPIELAGAFLGAICHDLDHPGLSNTYQNNESTALALKYKKDSPLERHHLSHFAVLCEKHGLLQHCSVEESTRLRGVVEAMILATDMAKHGALMGLIEEKLAVESYDPLATPEGVDMLLQIGLKCADISNQSRPWRVANRWNEAVYKEFYHEGDLDREAGRDVVKLNDKTTNKIPQSTVGFIGYVVAPLFEIYVSIMARCAVLNSEVASQALEECLVFMNKNKERYAAIAEGKFVDVNEQEPELTPANSPATSPCTSPLNAAVAAVTILQEEAVAARPPTAPVTPTTNS